MTGMSETPPQPERAEEESSSTRSDTRTDTRAEIARGVRDCWAVGLGLIPLGLAFGVLVVQTGFSWWWAPVFSFVIYAGSMEFLALSMVTGGVGVAASALTGFMVNFRHIFYGLSFPRHRIASPLARLYSTYALTDETYAIVSAMPREENPSGTRLLTIQVICQILWVGGGIAGALGGQLLPADLQGMEFALTALFLVLAWESFRNNPDLSLPLTAVTLAVLAAVVVPGNLLMVALTAYFAVLLARFFSPRLDSALRWTLPGTGSTGGTRATRDVL